MPSRKMKKERFLRFSMKSLFELGIINYTAQRRLCRSRHNGRFNFEHAREWRNAVDLHHLPEGTHSLAPRPGSLDRWTFQIGPRGRACTCNLSGLSGTPMLIGLHVIGAHGR